MIVREPMLASCHWSKKTRLWALGGLVSVVLFVSPERAWAEPTAQERALAETLFRDAKVLVDASKYDEACPKLEESQRLDPKPGTMLNLAVCREKQGKLAAAWSDYLEAASLAGRNGQKDRETFARDRAAALEKEVPKLRIVVPEPVAGIVIKLDGSILNPAAWGAATPVDAGEHLIEAAAEGYTAYSEKITVGRKASKLEFTVPKLSPVVVNNPEPVTTNLLPVSTLKNEPPLLPKGPPKKKEETPPPPHPGMPIALLGAVVAGGAGFVGLVVGSIFGAKTLSARDESGCVDISKTAVSCSPAGKALYEDAQKSAFISSVGFGVGIAGLGAGLALVLTAPRASSAPSASPRPSQGFLVPVVGPGVMGAMAGFSF